MIPELTHLQFLILMIIGGLERPGRYVREKLAEEGDKRSLPAFYQVMARLEEAGMVEGSAHRIEVERHSVTERRYKVTLAGRKALAEAQDFYAARDLQKLGGRTVARG